MLHQRTFPGLEVITYEGPLGVGSDEWAANMSRDPQVVLASDPSAMPLWCCQEHSHATYNVTSLLFLQSMAQLFADHKAMAEFLCKDNATVQQLNITGIFHISTYRLALMTVHASAPCINFGR